MRFDPPRAIGFGPLFFHLPRSIFEKSALTAEWGQTGPWRAFGGAIPAPWQNPEPRGDLLPFGPPHGPKWGSGLGETLIFKVTLLAGFGLLFENLQKHMVKRPIWPLGGVFWAAWEPLLDPMRPLRE